MAANNHFWAWELKKDAKSPPSKRQVYYIDLINNKANCYGAVVYPENFEEEFLKLSNICAGPPEPIQRQVQGNTDGQVGEEE